MNKQDTENITSWDKRTADAILNELYHVDVSTRVYGNGWSRYLDDLAEKYGAEMDSRPRLYISVIP